MYVIGQLVFTAGMAIMAAVRHKVAVVLLSPTAGIMYATLFTMPYLLVAHYHTSGLVRALPVASCTDSLLSTLWVEWIRIRFWFLLMHTEILVQLLKLILCT